MTIDLILPSIHGFTRSSVFLNPFAAMTIRIAPTERGPSRTRCPTTVENLQSRAFCRSAINARQSQLFGSSQGRVGLLAPTRPPNPVNISTTKRIDGLKSWTRPSQEGQTGRVVFLQSLVARTVLAAGLGFEPRHTAPKTVVLPLDDPATGKSVYPFAPRRIGRILG